jgi:hypothetical protein
MVMVDERMATTDGLNLRNRCLLDKFCPRLLAMYGSHTRRCSASGILCLHQRIAPICGQMQMLLDFDTTIAFIIASPVDEGLLAADKFS